jgi:hypothetical protein
MNLLDDYGGDFGGEFGGEFGQDHGGDSKLLHQGFFHGTPPRLEAGGDARS